MIKLLDYSQRQSELEASRNPFATVVMAHLAALQTWALLNQDMNCENHADRRDAINPCLYKGWGKLLSEFFRQFPLAELTEELDLSRDRRLSPHKQKRDANSITFQSTQLRNTHT